MHCTPTEAMRKFWHSYRQWSGYHITVCQVNTALSSKKPDFKYEGRKSIVLNLTVALSGYTSYWCQYNCFADFTNLLQATQRTVTR